MISSGAFGLIGALSLTLGLLALSVWILKRVQAGGAGGASDIPLRVVRRISIGPRQSILLLRVGERLLVLASGDKGTQLLTEVDDAALLAAGSDTVSAAGADNPSKSAFVRGRKGRSVSFASLLRLGIIVVLAILPCAAMGQAMHHPLPSAQLILEAPGTESGVAPPIVPPVDIRIGEGRNALQLTGAVGLVVVIGLMTLLPALFLLMTSFTRILIVLHFLRPALGTQTAPPAQILTALAVLLTGVVMSPVLQETNRAALQPYIRGEITQGEAFTLGVAPFREFMLENTREKDLATFVDLSGSPEVESIDQIPTITVVSAFVTSELRTAFQMGFVLFLPFIVVDLIVASVLMSLGMFMLPPMMVSLPFKLLLFVLADGWTLVVRSLVVSFR